VNLNYITFEFLASGQFKRVYDSAEF